ncbi:DCC-interacting protein 13-alpha-like [Limulus polyphemus]|uniref:DCC-interacting protein 13-alpha-like n=1 Tax=Limulus polyphemus TaxID=6850 RepID=A0ABM1T3W7_LIMPO|nr:DCC-interacting protein 13-alpha-like [Limulus polyphemus]
MPGPEKLHLEDALNDDPQTRSMVSLFEQDSQLLKKYIESLYGHCEKVLNAQKELASATSGLADHVRSYKAQGFYLDTDPDSILSSILQHFVSTLDEISSWQQMCATQLTDGMMFPLNRFIEADLTEVSAMAEMFHIASNELEHCFAKFCKVPRKRESDKHRQETNEEVYIANKKFHQMALHYYASLNSLQYKRKIALIEPLLGYISSLKSHFSVGNDAMNTSEMETFISSISASVQEVQSELNHKTLTAVSLIDSIEKQSQHLYYAEPLSDMPFIPPNTSLTQKSGYLYHKTKFAGMVTKWDRVYMYTLGGHLMCLSKGEVAGCSMMELDRTVAAQALEHEDRRNVFHITNGKKIATIHNIAKESFSSRDRGNPPSQPSQEKLHNIPKPQKPSPVSPVPNISSNENKKSLTLSGPLPTPPSSPIDHLVLDVPIQFDMFSPSEELQSNKEPKEGPPLRINPFDQSSLTISAEAAKDTTSPFWEVYPVRFMGTMQVKKDRGDQVVYETIRQIMAARAIHNIFKMSESHLVVTHEFLKVLDPSHQAVRAIFPLEDISFWTTHRDNKRLLGFITRTRSENIEQATFHCHVFEVQTSAEEICGALTTAANIALNKIMVRKKNEEDKTSELLDDVTEKDILGPTISEDGKFLILDKQSSELNTVSSNTIQDQPAACQLEHKRKVSEESEA